MLVGKFGPKSFEVSSKKILTFHDLTVSGELETESGNAVGKVKTTTVKGIDPLKISLELTLQTVLGVDAEEEMYGWFALKDASIPYPFVLCGRALSLHKFLLTNCDASDFGITPAGLSPRITSVKLKLQFQEYVPPGAQSSTAKKSTSKKSPKSAKGISTEVIQAADPYKVPTSAEKAAAKR